ncbi:MAG TPA: Crp/Fnr family transcriptional regulator [Pyrinomonadaceae bacterium]
MKEMLTTNKLLSRLRDVEFARLMPLLQPVSLSAGERLSEAGQAARFIYFPESCVISCQANMEDGKSAEVGIIGFEGLADITALNGSRPAVHSLNVSIGGSALRVRKDDFERELRRSEGLQQSLLGYSAEYVTQLSQRSACAIFHQVEQRFAVWLLLLADRIKEAVIQITQERTADHLGVRRAGVTVVALHMQAAGAISYKRGNLRITNREMLEAMACECYGTLAVDRPHHTTYM